jgi:hypothetical protein
MYCGVCGKELVEDFAFCPQCGRAVSPDRRPGGPPIRSPQSVATKDSPEMPTSPADGAVGNTPVVVGTFVFGAFSAISLIVSIVKGIVPIYLLASAAWACAAWFWHKRSSKKEVARAIVVVLGALAAVGEVALLASQHESGHAQIPGTVQPDPFAQYAVATSPSGRDSNAPATETESKSPIGDTHQESTVSASARVSSAKLGDGRVAAGAHSAEAGARPAKESRQEAASPPCPESLAPGEIRSPMALDSDQLALVKASMQSVSEERRFLLKAHNGTGLCITSVKVSLVYDDDERGYRSYTNTLELSPSPLAPGQDREMFVCVYDESLRKEFTGGALEPPCRIGPLEKWDLTSVFGYPAARESS